MKYLLIIGSMLLLSPNHSLFAQGIKGHVYWREGNFMPGPNYKARDEKGVQREILFFPLTNMREVKMDGSFVEKMPGDPVAKVISTPDGTFKVRMKPGRYSVVVREKDGLYANRFDQDGNIFPVKVARRRFTVLQIIIDYKAAY